MYRKKKTTKKKKHVSSDHGEATLWSAEEKEEEGERRARRGNGAVEAWTDQDVDGIGVASQGYFCVACLVETE